MLWRNHYYTTEWELSWELKKKTQTPFIKTLSGSLSSFSLWYLLSMIDRSESRLLFSVHRLCWCWCEARGGRGQGLQGQVSEQPGRSTAQTGAAWRGSKHQPQCPGPWARQRQSPVPDGEGGLCNLLTSLSKKIKQKNKLSAVLDCSLGFALSPSCCQIRENTKRPWKCWKRPWN